MANQNTGAAPAASSSTSEKIDIGKNIAEKLLSRLQENEAKEAADDGREMETLTLADVNESLSGVTEIRFLVTNDGLQWRKDKAAPHLKSGGYVVFAMFRYPFGATTDDYDGVKVYLLPDLKNPPKEPTLLMIEIPEERITAVCNEFGDHETFEDEIVEELFAACMDGGAPSDDEPEVPGNPDDDDDDDDAPVAAVGPNGAPSPAGASA